MVEKKNLCPTREEAYELVKNLLKTNFSMEPLLNDDNINRHALFHVTNSNDINYIVKFFNSSTKWFNEIKTLKLLNSTDVKAPELVLCFSNKNVNCTIVEYKDGVDLSKVFDEMDTEKQKNIMFELGIELGKIHSLRKFDTFGEWNENEKILYYDKIVNKLDELEGIFISNKNEDLDTINKSIREIKKNKKLFEEIKLSRLCHRDFQPRNIIVNEDYKLKSVIDFEHSVPWCSEDDFCILYNKVFKNRPNLEKAFMDGYNNNCKLNSNSTEILNLHLLLEGLKICSFRYKNYDPYGTLYQSGISLLNKQLNKKSLVA